MMSKRYIRAALLGTSALIMSACTSSMNYPAVATPSGNAEGQKQAQASELRRIADELSANGDHKAAIPLYRHLAAKDGDPAALNALANSLIEQGATDEAIDILIMLVEREQATVGTWYNLGKVQLSTGVFDEALTSFNQAATLDPSHIKARSGRAISLAALGRISEAIAAFDSKSDTITLSNKALVFAATGRPEVAVTILEPIMQAGISSARDRQNLAMAYLLDGKEEEAYRIARIDLDAATTHETFTFYRSLGSLKNDERMQALVTGVIKPEWTRTEMANLELRESKEKQVAAERVTKKQPVMVAEAVKVITPKPVIAPPKPTEPEEPVQPKENPRADYVLTTVPPLIEPEGWALQIGAYRTIENLMRGWTILYRQSGDLLESVPPRRSEVDFGTSHKGPPKGFYYRLNAGPLKSFSKAKELCNALIERGTKCWIRPPEKAEGKLSPTTTVKKKPATNSLETDVTITADAST